MPKEDYSIATLSNHHGVIVEEVVVKPGKEIPLHYHPMEDKGEQKVETYYWQRGAGELTYDNKVVSWPEFPAHIEENGGAGQKAYSIPAGSCHGVKNTGITPLVFLAIYKAPSSGTFQTLFK